VRVRACFSPHDGSAIRSTSVRLKMPARPPTGLCLVRRELTRYLDQDRRLDTPGLFVKSSDHTLCSAAGSPSGSSRMVRCRR